MATTVTLKPNAIDISGSTSGTTTLQATAVAGTTTLTLPAATDTLVGKATTDTLTNKTLTSPTITGGVLNGTLGATTPSTVAATSITASTTLGVTGVSTFSAGTAALPAITTSGDTNTGIFFPAADTIAFSEGGAEAMRIDSSGNVLVGTTSAATPSTTGFISVANTFGFKNRIINGAMLIDQRYAGTATTNAINGYTVDRWTVQQSTTGKLIAQQNAGSVTPPTGYTKYLGVTSQSAYAVAAGDFYTIFQVIEGFNTADLLWGTANAQTVTLSFRVYSSLTGTFGGSLRNLAGNRSYPFTYTISSANTWTTVSITIAGDTSGTWVTDNTAGIYLYIGLGVGTTYSGTASAWAAGNFFSATGATSVVGTNTATFYITGVQLEKGSTATSFDYRPYGTELALCQRYYEVGGYNGTGIWSGNSTNAVAYYYSNQYVVAKRATPTTTTTTNFGASGFPTTASTIVYNSVGSFLATRTSNATTNGAYFTDTWVASAEL